jgi:PAS domain S-box-containing protein
MISILYVDDEPDMLEIGKIFLEKSGQFIVDTITSAPAALTLLSSKPYDAIIADYQMPGMNGIEFLKEVRSTGNTLPFILFTGRGREDVVIQALNEGADFYLQKGGEPKSQFAELSNKIRYAVLKRRAEESLRQNEAQLRQIIDLVPHMIFANDRDGNFLLVNRAVARYYNTTVAEIVGKPQARFHRSTTELRQMLDDNREVMTTGITKVIPEEPFTDASGNHHILQTIKVPITTLGNNQQAVLGVSTDITERKKSETELRRAYELITAQEEELRGQFDSMVALQKRTAESQQMLAEVLNTVPVRVFWKDVDLRFKGSNEPFARDAGLSAPADLIGKTDFDMAWREQAEMYRTDDRKVIDTGIPKIGYEEPQTGADGKRIWLRTSKIPLRDPGGTIIGILGTYEDISEYKRAEEAVRESEEKFRGIFDTINDGLHINEITPDGKPGKFIEVNEVACRMLQYTREELLAQGPLDFVTGYHSRPFTDIIGELSTTGHAIFETKHRRKDGTIVPVEINNHVVSLQGKRVMVGVVRDITDRKRTENAMRESEEKFRTVVENSLDGILIVALTGEILFGNRAAANLVDAPGTPDRIGTKNLLDFIAPESRSQVLHDLSQVAQGIDSYPMNYQAITATGRQIWVEGIGKRIQFQNSPVILISMRDITSRKHMEDAILRANKQLNLLSSITRHDINNQLQVLNGFAELLRIKIPDPSFEDYFSRIIEASSQITSMIRFTKEYEEIGIHAAVWQDLQTLLNSAGKGATLGQVTLKNDLPANTEVFADPLIVKVFFNLIDNALRHGGRITTIRFSFEARNGDGIIVYEDDGEGVPEENKEKIFMRGFGKNTGFGLTISREILDITGITIKETGEPGKGARFEITVPMGVYRFTNEK